MKFLDKSKGFDFTTRLAILLMLVASYACQKTNSSNITISGQSSDEESPLDSEELPSLEFATFNHMLNEGFLASKFKKPRFNICMFGVLSYDLDAAPFQPGSAAWQRWGESIRSGIAAWIDPLRDRSGVPAETKIRVLPKNSGDDCDIIVEVKPGIWPHARPKKITTIVLDTAVTRHGIVHEIGHAFGLADTYVVQGGIGVCRDANLPSVMCSGVSELMQDDIEGIRQIFARTVQTEFSQDTYGNDLVSYQGLNPQSPQQIPAGVNSTPPTENNSQYALAIKPSAQGELRVFVSEKGEKNKVAYACVGKTDEDCEVKNPRQVLNKSKYTVYELESIPNDENSNLIVKILDDKKNLLKRFRLERDPS